MVFQNDILAGASGVASTYEIDQSIRFNSADSAYVTRTPASTGDQKKWTTSFWVKRCKTGVTDYLMTAGQTGTNNGVCGIYIYSDDTIHTYFDTTGANPAGSLNSRKFRDPSAWYHFIWAVDALNTVQRVWVNGEELSVDASKNPPNFAYDMNATGSGKRMSFATQAWGHATFADIYAAEIHHLDGEYITDPTTFGEYNDDGVWVPKAYAGTYGTNGFYITGETAGDLGEDFSGNGNDFTSSGLTSDDQVSDSPTLNFPVISPIDYQTGSNVTISNGNLTFQNANSGSANDARATFAVNSGKWYWEVEADALGQSGVGREFIGVVSPEWLLTSGSAGSNFSQDSTGYAYNTVGQKLNNGSAASYGSALSAGNIVGVALDLDNGKIWWSVNGTFQASGNPAAGTSEAYSGLSGTFAPAFAVDYGTGTSRLIANFGQTGGLTYTPPTGFSQIDSSTLLTPAVTDGSAYFNTILYTGNGSASTRSFTGVGFQPDFVWKKVRSRADHHWLHDAVRGADKGLNSDRKDSEYTSTRLTSFDSDGFSFATSDPDTNGSGSTYVAWNWLAGNGTATNEDGSITSTVSANVDAGFNVIGYTGNETSGATIGHGLGAAPSVVITKSRSSSSYHWYVYHQSNGATKYMRLNDNSAAFTDSAAWNNTAPTSSVITLGNSSATNHTGTMIAYAFAEVEGFSKFGSYTGNGSTDGPFIWCGFKPAFVIAKRTNSADNWAMYDAARDPYNVAEKYLYADTTAAETTYSTAKIDFLSNGFKWRGAVNFGNASGSTYIFMAFAENPFGGDGVAPATAR